MQTKGSGVGIHSEPTIEPHKPASPAARRRLWFIAATTARGRKRCTDESQVELLPSGVMTARREGLLFAFLGVRRRRGEGEILVALRGGGQEAGMAPTKGMAERRVRQEREFCVLVSVLP